MSFDPTRAAPSVVRWAPCGPGGFGEPRPTQERPPTTRLRYAVLLLAGALLQALPIKVTDGPVAQPPVVIARAPEPEAPPAALPRPVPRAIRAAAVAAAPVMAAGQPAAPLVMRPRDPTAAPRTPSDHMGLLGGGRLDLSAREGAEYPMRSDAGF